MAKSDFYFRFPLPLLASGPPDEVLQRMLATGIMNAGFALRHTDEAKVKRIARASRVTFDDRLDDDEESQCIAKDESAIDDPDGLACYEDVVAGAHVTGVRLGNWRDMLDHYLAGDAHCERWPESGQAVVTLSARWLWNAIGTQEYLRQGSTEVKEYNPTKDWLDWRELRVLCAVLSVIGKKPFAWISTATLTHRACGYTSRAGWLKAHPCRDAGEAIEQHGTALGAAAGGTGFVGPGANVGGHDGASVGLAGSSSSGSWASHSRSGDEPQHCPPLTRWQIEATLTNLERNRFFLRYRTSSSATGRGGRTAYSIRHATRERLARDVRTALQRRQGIDVRLNRQADRALWAAAGDSEGDVNAAVADMGAAGGGLAAAAGLSLRDGSAACHGR